MVQKYVSICFGVFSTAFTCMGMTSAAFLATMERASFAAEQASQTPPGSVNKNEAEGSTATTQAKSSEAESKYPIGMSPGGFGERDGVFGKESRPIDSPQHITLEFRFLPYSPNIDDEPSLSGTKPFLNTFGSKEDKASGSVGARLMVGTELDYQAFRIPYIGTIGPGISAGYTRFSAPAKVKSSGEASGQDTYLSIAAFSANAVLRIDEPMRRFGIPFVPYGKLGLGMAYWWATGADGITRVGSGPNSSSGYGLSTGPSLAVGLMANLNWIDERAAKSADQAIGVNNTYLFAEYWSYSLKSGSSMYVGTNTFVFGLAFDF